MKSISFALLTFACPFLASAATEKLNNTQQKTIGITTTTGDRVAIDFETAKKISEEVISIVTFDGNTVEVTVGELSRSVSRRMATEEGLRLNKINERRGKAYYPGQRF